MKYFIIKDRQTADLDILVAHSGLFRSFWETFRLNNRDDYLGFVLLKHILAEKTELVTCTSTIRSLSVHLGVRSI